MTEASPPKPPPAAPVLPRRPTAAVGPSSGPRSLSDGQKEALAIQALGLLNEQVQARIVQCKTELETSSEVDAVTLEVAAQLKAMQASVSAEVGGAKTREDEREKHDKTEELQTRTLSALLLRFFSGQTQFAARILKPAGKKLGKLFFESELYENSKREHDREREKVICHPEQGVYYTLLRHKNRLRAELEGFTFQSPEVRQATLELLSKLERDLQIAFMSRRSPELNRVMAIYTAVLVDFLQQYLPPRLEQMSKVAVRVSRAARQPNSVGNKVLADAFDDFRAEWERLFMQQMVSFCGEELLERLTQSKAEFQSETLKLFTDPRVFSETCAVICEQLYDFLGVEGFLDLPVDWRLSLPSES